MKNDGRYTVPADQDYQEGSNNEVLKNHLGITCKDEMELLETKNLLRTTEYATQYFEVDHKFSADDLILLHKHWLGDIYPWAGEYRSVNMSKGGFPFANASFIPPLMKDFTKKELAKYTPGMQFEEIDTLALALAVVHVEFILIHPFREGNGRLGRLLSTLMVLQAGYEAPDFSVIDAESAMFHEYVAAIQQGLDQNYDKAERIFLKILELSG